MSFPTIMVSFVISKNYLSSYLNRYTCWVTPHGVAVHLLHLNPSCIWYPSRSSMINFIQESNTIQSWLDNGITCRKVYFHCFDVP